MTDDRTAVARGERALVELALTEAAMAGLRQAALEEVVITPPEAGAKRERLIVCAQVIDAVLRALQAGMRINTGVSRSSVTFFWEGGLRCETFDIDEGRSLRDSSEAELRATLEREPQPFRRALGID